MATSTVQQKQVEIQVSGRTVHYGTVVAYSDTKGYLVQFKNGTQQWIPVQYVKEAKA